MDSLRSSERPVVDFSAGTPSPNVRGVRLPVWARGLEPEAVPPSSPSLRFGIEIPADDADRSNGLSRGSSDPIFLELNADDAAALFSGRVHWRLLPVWF